MDFEVTEERERDGILVIAVRGEIDLDTAGELRRRLESRDGNLPPLVLDLTGCAFLDSAGVSLIVRTARQADGGGRSGFAVAAAPDSHARRALRLTNVDSRIAVLGSREAALETVRSSR
jgi:stage II sporulation protein AA (anti-sigma F factor antagonist)